jgi:curli biogenesis system outer membrane secretion channel CsgG
MKLGKVIPGVLAIILAISACGPKPEVYFKRDISFKPAKTIAILPFNNYSGKEDAGKQVSNMFLVELLKKPYFIVLEPGEVDRVMREERIRSSEQIDYAAAKVFKEHLAADYILIGAVNEFSYLTRSEREVPLVGFSVRLLDTNTGQIVWAANHSRKGDDSELLFGWGLVKSLTKLAQISVGQVARRINIEH